MLSSRSGLMCLTRTDAVKPGHVVRAAALNASRQVPAVLSQHTDSCATSSGYQREREHTSEATMNE